MTDQPSEPPSAPGAGGLTVAVAQLRGRVGELSRTLFAARGSGELMDTVAEIEALKSTLDALELAVVRELEATGAVKPVGWASTQDFVTSVAGGTKATGPAMVRLAKAVEAPGLAPVGEAMADGWLSTVKAHVIERAVEELPGDLDLRGRAVQVLLDEAKRLDATELRKVTRRLLTIVDPTGDERRDEKTLDREERAAHLNRFLKVTDDQAGGAWIKGRCSSEDAALIKATLIPLAAPHPSAGPVCDPGSCVIPGCGHDGRDPRDHGARMLDAFTELCRRSQTAEVLPDCHGASPRVTVRRLCCDAEIVPVVLGGVSGVLDVGRQMRLASVAIWKALVARDGHCRFPNCTRPPVMCHGHHLVHWIDGGPTSLANMILLCGHHHRLIHAGPGQSGEPDRTTTTSNRHPGPDEPQPGPGRHHSSEPLLRSEPSRTGFLRTTPGRPSRRPRRGGGGPRSPGPPCAGGRWWSLRRPGR